MKLHVLMDFTVLTVFSCVIALETFHVTDLMGPASVHQDVMVTSVTKIAPKAFLA